MSLFIFCIEMCVAFEKQHPDTPVTACIYSTSGVPWKLKVAKCFCLIVPNDVSFCQDERQQVFRKTTIKEEKQFMSALQFSWSLIVIISATLTKDTNRADQWHADIHLCFKGGLLTPANEAR